MEPVSFWWYIPTGIDPMKIQAYSLHSGGATALLCAGTDPLYIQLIGRWNSQAMLRYLRSQAGPVMLQQSAKMLQHGSYSFNPPPAGCTHASLHLDDIPALLDDPVEDVLLVEAF